MQHAGIIEPPCLLRSEQLLLSLRFKRQCGPYGGYVWPLHVCAAEAVCALLPCLALPAQHSTLCHTVLS